MSGDELSPDQAIEFDLTDLKLLHREGEVEKDGIVIEASEGCSELLQAAEDRGVRL